MPDNHPPKHDGEKNLGQFQFSLGTLFVWMTMAAITIKLNTVNLFSPPYIYFVFAFAIVSASLTAAGYIVLYLRDRA